MDEEQNKLASVKYIGSKELADVFSVTKQTVHSWARDGAPHLKLGRSFRWQLSKVESWLQESGKNQAPAETASAEIQEEEEQEIVESTVDESMANDLYE